MERAGSPNHEDDDPDIHMVLLVAHFAAYLSAVFLVLSPLTAVTFILVHQCLWGVYMGCSFAPGHKGIPTVAP